MRSGERARIECLRESHNTLLIGSKSQVVELTNCDHEKICASLSLCRTEVSKIVSVTKRCFVKNLGYDGTVLSNSDKVIVSHHETETVVSIERFMSINCGTQGYHLVGEGTVKPFHLTDNGETVRNILNGFPKVKLQPDGEKLFFVPENIQRKVMLYDYGDNVATVVDYMRKLKKLPYELVVPVYPEQNDMLLIQGEEPGDVWYAKVISVDRARQTIDVYFYVERHQDSGRFVRETIGRTARNTVSFDSIIAVVHGQWINANCWEKAI